MQIVFYVSGHGFGHASRDIELIRALCAGRADARIVVRTAAPERLFAPIAGASVDVQTVEADTGLVQVDSLQLDEDESARQAARFYADFDRRVAEEAALVDSVKADVIVGDIPPLAFAAAVRAGVPSVAVGNFTWDWIYSVYPAFDRLAPDGNRPAVLPSFGAYGADLPLAELRRSDRFALIEPARDPSPGWLYQDFVAAADVVVSKPGYGIVSECVANETALLYTSRGRFVEYDVLVAEMPRVLRCRYISQQDLLAGRWADAIEALLAQPAPAERPRVDGASVAADAIMNLVIE